MRYERGNWGLSPVLFTSECACGTAEVEKDARRDSGRGAHEYLLHHRGKQTPDVPDRGEGAVLTCESP
jgi:hypothetical protein